MQQQQQQQQQSRSQASTSQPSWDLGNGSFLPMYSNDLGRIPLHAGYPMENSMPSQPSTSGLWYTPSSSSAPGSNMPPSFDVNQFFFGQLNGYPTGPVASDDMVNTAAATQQMHISNAGAGDTIAMWSNAPTGFE
jgi:hypothetical protein